MSKDTITLRLKDMYAIKHSLQDTLIKKKEELNFLEQQDIENSMKIQQLESDIDHEEFLIRKIIKEIKHFKFKNKIK